MSSVVTKPVKIKPGSTLEAAWAFLIHATLNQCVKCTICETQCPALRVTKKSPGPKYVGPQAECYRRGYSMDHSLDYCSERPICFTFCPQGVKIAEINTQARVVMRAGHIPLCNRLIIQTELEGKLSTSFAPIANWALDAKWLRKLVEVVIEVHVEAPTPKAQFHSFMHWRKHHTPQAMGARGTLVSFHDYAGGYFEASIPTATMRVLEHLGYRILVPKQGCCDLASQSNGLFDIANKPVLELCRDLRATGDNLTVISPSGSCAGMLRHEAHEIIGADAAELRDVGSRVAETSESLVELSDEGEFPVEELCPTDSEVIYRQLCQVKSQGIGELVIRLLEAIPGMKVMEPGEPCYGIGGIYGLKKEKFKVAQAIGKSLLNKIRTINPELVLCETETCRWRIRKGTGVEVIHPVELLCKALGPSTEGR